jgi:hypothetical protein
MEGGAYDRGEHISRVLDKFCNVIEFEYHCENTDSQGT